MRRVCSDPLIFVVALLTFIAIIDYCSAPETFGAENNKAVLTLNDCVKCHKKESATIKENGAKHGSAVTCMDCHVDHPLLGDKVIPQCSQCHSGKNHYKLDNCLSCHSDPHQPMNIIIKGAVTKPCLSCHPKQGAEFSRYASYHAELACNYCHYKHGYVPECFKCHDAHLEGQTLSDCHGCHPAHSPLIIEYPLDTPSAFCSACHEKEGGLMAKTTTKHQSFTCAYCHRGIHPLIPQCRSCHGEPHSSIMHKSMPDCISCHIDPHNLKT